MFGMPPTRPAANAAEAARAETPSIADQRRDRVERQLAAARVNLVALDRFANRAPLSLRHELTPRLTRLRAMEKDAAEQLRQLRAVDSPTLPILGALLQDESDALLALGESLTPQAFTHHLQQREALDDRCRETLGRLPRDEWPREALSAYSEALRQLDTTDDAWQLPDALADVQSALDQVCALVAARQGAPRGSDPRLRNP